MSYRLFQAATVAASVYLLAGCSAANNPLVAEEVVEAPKTIVTSPADERGYRAITLENGLDVVLVSAPKSEKSAAALSVGVGFLHDPMEYQGLAHFLEHMLFLGTKKYPESNGYADFIAANGGERNAYTYFEETNYFFSVNNDAFAEGLDRFTDFFKTPLLDPQYIDKEKNAVNAEWTLRRESDTRIESRLKRGLLGDHPVNRFFPGNLDSLEDKPGGSLYDATRAFYDKYYSANLMRVALYSNRPLDEMEALTRKYFADIENNDVPEPTIDAPIDFDVAGNQLIHYEPQADKRQVKMTWLIDNNIDQYASKPNRYLLYILGSEMPNTPAKRLKELGWISNLYVNGDPSLYGNYGMFNISIEVTPEGMPHREKIVATVISYIEMLREEGVDDRYADELSTSLANEFRFLEATSAVSYASGLASSMHDYPIKDIIANPYVFEGFNQSAVDTVLSQLTPDRLTVMFSAKGEPVDTPIEYYNGQYSVESLDVLGVVTDGTIAAQLGLQLPKQNTLLPKDFELKHPINRPTLSFNEGDTSLWVQGSEYFTNQPKGVAQIYFNTASSAASAKARVLQQIWQDLFFIEQSELLNEAGLAGMNLDTSSDFGLTLSMSGFTDRQLDLLGRALDGLRVKPSEQEMTQAKDRFARSLENQKRSPPYARAFGQTSQTLKSGDFSDAALAEANQGITPEDLLAYVESQLATARVYGYLFGNYSEDDVQAMGKLINDRVPHTAAAPYIRADVFDPAPETRLVFHEDVPVEDVGMVYGLISPRTDDTAKAAGGVLSDFIREATFNQLRTEEQIGYSVGAFSSKVGERAAFFYYAQTPVLNSQALYDRFVAWAAETNSLIQDMTSEEFEVWRAAKLAALTERPENLSREVAPFLADWRLEKYGFDTRRREIAAVNAITLEEAKAYFADLLTNPDIPSLVVEARGTRFDAPFAAVEGATIVSKVEEFHAVMPTQPK